MRDFIMLIGLCVVIIWGAWFLLPGASHKFLNTAPAAKAASPAPTPVETAEVSKTAKPKKSNPGHRVEDAPTQVVQAPSSLAASGLSTWTQPAPNFSRVPAAQEVRLGTDGADLIKTFGTPMATAYTVDSGHYFETYFYRGERAQATIRLRDGKVYSVLAR